MSTTGTGDSIVAKWAWVALAGVVLVMFIAVLWSASSPKPTSDKLDVSRTPRPAASAAGPTATYQPPPTPAFPMGSAPTSTPSFPAPAPVVRVTPRSMPTPPIVPEAKPKPISATTGMFPMGDVVRQQTPTYHPYRGPRETFGSFMYGSKLWQFTGRYATGDALDLTPTGFDLGGRGMFAFANSSAPDKVLFVQSALDPGKFAIYR